MDVNSDKDVTRITMKFVRPIVDSAKVIKTRYLDIPTQGGMRVNSSAGMSFAGRPVAILHGSAFSVPDVEQPRLDAAAGDVAVG